MKLFKAITTTFSTFKSFTQLQVLNQYLLRNQPYLSIIYFNAKWNPYCKITSQHLHSLHVKYPQIEIIQINSDIAPKIAKHYYVKAQPQFVFCLNGDEIVRQTGPNQQGLLQKCQIMIQKSRNKQKQQWTPYGTNFDLYYKSYKNKSTI